MIKRTFLPPEKSIAFQIRRVHLSFERLLTARLAKHRLKAGYYNYLRALWIRDNVTQRELSASTSVTETTTVQLLKGMAKEGLVDRVQDDQDRRKTLVSLTKRGRALEPLIMPYAYEINDIALKNITNAEIEACAVVLKKIMANLEDALTSSGAGKN